MARRPPAAVRAALPVRPREGRPFSIIAGLPRWVLADIHRVEATHLRPGHVATAVRDLREYARVAHRTGASLTLGCPCCEPDTRRTIEEALSALPPRSRRALRAVVEPFNEEIRRKTVPDPTAPAEWSWWRRRISY